MTTIGLFYGSTTDNTAVVAEEIRKQFNALVPGAIELFDIGLVEIFDLLKYDNLIVGCPTWNIGELQDDWDIAYEELVNMDFTGIKVAVFGVGDQYGYPDNFCDAIGILGLKMREQGAELIGLTDMNDSYDFYESVGVENGRWLGLAIDEDNQRELTAGRVTDWVRQLVAEFGLASAEKEGS